MAKKKSLRQQVLHSLDRIEKEYEKAIAEAKRRRSSLESKILKKLKPKPPRPSHGAKKK
jgi:hypothetical protein